jgi:hypothetical protein
LTTETSFWTHRKLMASITAVSLPSVTYLLTLSRISSLSSIWDSNGGDDCKDVTMYTIWLRRTSWGRGRTLSNSFPVGLCNCAVSNTDVDRFYWPHLSMGILVTLLSLPRLKGKTRKNSGQKR